MSGVVGVVRRRVEPLERLRESLLAGDKCDEVLDLRRVVFDAEGIAVGERCRGETVAAGRATHAEVYPTGIHEFQHAEVLGDLERRIVRQHHAAGADANAVRLARHAGDENLRG